MKLYIFDNGDTSVGIMPTSFSIEVPFNQNEVDSETLEWFKDGQLDLYKEFAEGRLIAFYDFENIE